MTRMRRGFRFLLSILIVLGALLGAGAGLFRYFVYTPEAAIPSLSGTLVKGSVAVNGRKRTYTAYVPRMLRSEAPLVVVMHGSGQTGAQIRRETGYGFERLADVNGFVVAYPNAYEGYWDVCSKVGALNTHETGINDVEFLTQLVDKLSDELNVDPARAFATGSSRGGSMALRLALETPSRFRAVAAVSANVPTPDNFKCHPAGQRTSSVMLLNGTDDPLVPFDGGDVSLFRLFYKNGDVLSSRDSGSYIAKLNQIVGDPQTSVTKAAGGIEVERTLWGKGLEVEVELVAVHGSGHGMPQPYQRRPRILGPSSAEPNGPEIIWEFFNRQLPEPRSLGSPPIVRNDGVRFSSRRPEYVRVHLASSRTRSANLKCLGANA